MVRFVLFSFLLVFIVSCKSTTCTIDNRLIVKEYADIDLSFLEEKKLDENDFELIFSGKRLKELNLEHLKGIDISFDNFQSVPMISTYEYNEKESWEDYKSYALKNSVLYFLGSIEFDNLNLYIFLDESPSLYQDYQNRAIYMISVGNREKWCTPVSVSFFGVDSQMITATKKKGNMFIYKDFSYNDNSCGKYKFEKSGRIKLIN